jgi:2-hydroxychromene-2-carboxylate isomerase
MKCTRHNHIQMYFEFSSPPSYMTSPIAMKSGLIRRVVSFEGDNLVILVTY